MLRSRSHCKIEPCVVWALFCRAWYTNRPFSALVGRLAAGLRSAWSASTTKNSASWPLAVCSITHGAILFAAANPFICILAWTCRRPWLC